MSSLQYLRGEKTIKEGVRLKRCNNLIEKLLKENDEEEK